MNPICRGIWASDLQPNQELPIGGGLGDELFLKLHLDFDNIGGLEPYFSPGRLSEVYSANEADVRTYLSILVLN